MPGRGPLVLTVAVVLLFAGPLVDDGVEAHGGAVNVRVSCEASDPLRSLTTHCTALLNYLDGDPVLRARLVMTAEREGGPALAPMPFQRGNARGVYVLMVTFPAYGRWRMRFDVLEPGRGGARLDANLLPPVPGSVPQLQARLRLVVRFGPADVRYIAVRTVHLLAAIAWFALTALVLVLWRATAPEHRQRVLHPVARLLPWAAGISLLLLAASGAYTARNNAPAPVPGIFDPRALAALPFGGAYLAVFLVKMVLTLGIVVGTMALAVALRRAYGRPIADVSDAAINGASGKSRVERTVVWLAGANLFLGMLAFVSVVVLGYLHVITHLGATVGP